MYRLTIYILFSDLKKLKKMNPEAYSKPILTSNMEIFAKVDKIVLNVDKIFKYFIWCDLDVRIK